MITLNYQIDIKDLSFFKDNQNSLLVSLAPIYLKNSTTSELSYTNKCTKIAIATNDVLAIHLSIKNIANKYIKLLKFKFTDDEIFKFIPCSLVNSDTKEVYVSHSTDNNLTLLSSLRENEILNVKFYVKTNFTALDSNKINSLVKFFDYNKYCNDDCNRIYLVFKQSAIQLTSMPHKNLLEIENVGTSTLKDVVLHYPIPLGYKVNLGSLSATFNNSPCKIVAKQIGSELLLKLDSLPAKENNKTKAVHVFLEHIKYSLKLSDAKLSISITKDK